MNTEIKYRPQNIDDFIFSDQITEKKVRRYTDGKTLRPLVLYGTHGTGKTLLAEIIPKELDGQDVKIEKIAVDGLNSSTDVHNAFSRSECFDNIFQLEGQSRYYIVADEAHIEPRAKRALRTSLDNMADRHLAIFTTNEVEKLDSGLLSRAELIEVKPVPPSVFLPRAQKILRAEGFEIQDRVVLHALKSVYDMARDNRAYYKALDQIIEDLTSS